MTCCNLVMLPQPSKKSTVKPRFYRHGIQKFPNHRLSGLEKQHQDDTVS